MMPRLPWFIKKHRLHKAKTPIVRPLTDGEMVLARSVFGDLVDYQAVRVVNYPYVPWQADDVFIAPNGFIFVGGRHYQDDYAHAKPFLKQVFIHEMTHVMQYQQGVAVFWRGAYLQSLYYLTAKRYNPYHYVFDKDKNFWQYNIEQQGVICEDIYLGKLPNILCPRTPTHTGHSRRMPFKSPFRPRTRTCPHDDCHQTFDTVVYQHGVIFCPHCKQSILIPNKLNPPKGLGFWGIVRHTIKQDGWFLLGFCAVFCMVIYAITHITLPNFPAWLSVLLFMVAVIGFLVWVVRLDIKAQKGVKLGNRPIIKGVDTLDDIKDDFKISLALEDLKGKLSEPSPCCPNCQSQRLRLSPKNEYYHCLNCQQNHELNRKLKWLDYARLAMMFMVIFIINADLIHGDILKLIVAFGVLMVWAIIIGYFNHKTLKLLPKS